MINSVRELVSRLRLVANNSQRARYVHEEMVVGPPFDGSSGVGLRNYGVGDGMLAPARRSGINRDR
jgi:hypothetical protein